MLSQFVWIALLVAMTISAGASDFSVGDIVIDDPWARATAPVAPAGAGYLTLSNKGSEDDRLLAASADVAQVVELHTHLMEDNVMKMREVEFIEIPAGQQVSLQPGGLHIMFINLKAPLREGQVFPLTLSFEKAGETIVDVTVRKIGTQ